MEEVNISETTTEEEEPGRPSGAILSLALGRDFVTCSVILNQISTVYSEKQRVKLWAVPHN